MRVCYDEIMILYHEVDSSDVDSILREGLKRTSRGDKGDDKAIIKTDKLLDDARLASFAGQKL